MRCLGHRWSPWLPAHTVTSAGGFKYIVRGGGPLCLAFLQPISLHDNSGALLHSFFPSLNLSMLSSACAICWCYTSGNGLRSDVHAEVDTSASTFSIHQAQAVGHQGVIKLTKTLSESISWWSKEKIKATTGSPKGDDQQHHSSHLIFTRSWKRAQSLLCCQLLSMLMSFKRYLLK